MPHHSEHRHLTIEYGDRPGVTVSDDRAGLPDDCRCPAVRWCSRPPEISWPEPDCRHHGLAAYGLPMPDATILPFQARRTT
jgi:hypothetical protein